MSTEAGIENTPPLPLALPTMADFSVLPLRCKPQALPSSKTINAVCTPSLL